MFNLFNILPRLTPQETIRAPDVLDEGDDLLKNKQEINAILSSIEQHHLNSAVLLRVLSPDLSQGELLIAFKLDRVAGYMRVRLAQDYPGKSPRSLTLVAVWSGKVLAFSAQVLQQHTANEFTLSWPDCMVRGLGRDFYRFHPHADVALSIHSAEVQTSGRLVDLSEGGLAYVLPVDQAKPLLEIRRFGMAKIVLPAIEFQVASFVVRSEQGLGQSNLLRIGIEFFGVSAAEMMCLRRFLLVEWHH
ncbi:PilZ domain-containing protein [uncultured Deefgea sp.]|uniref:PilZ domain-containing protein n=1 Tax=uncultured Deefgea sp. TaxID=1304914 RepID=UPI00263325D6|nr:PilZ domain-containing protein [uncultured Deefgea sp.]